ncbi:MAG: dienelactone hydrolase family protein [Acidimicrobiales bacterium]
MDVSLNETEVMIETPEGSMGTFVVHPQGDGPFPVVLFLMDAPGKRELLHEMARRWARRGYYVLLPNLYYRVTPAFELDFASSESTHQMTELMMGLGNRMLERDATVLFEYADTDRRASAETVGCVGYCMSGPFAIWIAAAHAKRVKAAASIYGVRLAVDNPDSPHTRLSEITGELYVACAETDRHVPPEMVDQLEVAMADSGVAGRLERYPGTEHGFAFDDRPAYDATADAQHWNALFELFDRTLEPS